MTARQAAPLITAALLLATIVAAFLVAGAMSPAEAGLPAVASMSLDMDPGVGGSDENTATSVGERQNCARLNANGSLDADEDDVDAVQFDVVAQGIPPFDDGGTPDDPLDNTGGMLGFSFRIGYDESALTIESQDADFLVTVNPGSLISNASQTLPDPDDDTDQTEDAWTATVTDTGQPLSDVSEYGDGVLSRLVIAADEGIAADVYRLNIVFNAILDSANNALPTTEAFDGWIAVGQECPTGLDERAQQQDQADLDATATAEAGGGTGGQGGGGTPAAGTPGVGATSTAGPESGVGALAPAAAAAPAWAAIASGLGATGLFGGAAALVAGRLRRRGRRRRR